MIKTQQQKYGEMLWWSIKLIYRFGIVLCNFYFLIQIDIEKLKFTQKCIEFTKQKYQIILLNLKWKWIKYAWVELELENVASSTGLQKKFQLPTLQAEQKEADKWLVNELNNRRLKWIWTKSKENFKWKIAFRRDEK